MYDKILSITPIAISINKFLVKLPLKMMNNYY